MYPGSVTQGGAAVSVDRVWEAEILTYECRKAPVGMDGDSGG